MKFLLPVFFLLSFNANAFESTHVDISKRWKTLTSKDASEKRTKHLILKQKDEGLLIINSTKAFSLLINDQLVAINQTHVEYMLDSLKSIYTFPITLHLFSKDSESEIFSEMVMARIEGEPENGIRSEKGSSILLFVFILVWILVLLVHGQRSITLEYFRLSTLFSIRNQDDNIQTQRVTSFSNLFVYVFCSVLIALNLVALDLNPVEFTQFIAVQILVLAISVLALLFLKIVIVSTAAYFFGITETAPYQFFNFVKLSLVCFSFSSICLISGFIFNLDKNLLLSIAKIFALVILLVYLLMTFLRLNNKRESTVFHLFSYLCISEIFPVLLLLKIYYF